jgi:hypothetical protein
VAGGVAVAEKLGSASFLREVHDAFVHGMDIMLWACGGIALTAALLAVAFLPTRSSRPASEPSAEVLAAPVDGPARQRAE